MAYIYKITNLINGKVYIGKTTRNIESRFYEHKYTAENIGSHNSAYPLYQAMRKYGIENFDFEILEECDDLIIDDKEKEYIKLYNSYIGFKNCNGYNATLGGDGAIKHERQLIYELWDEGASIKEISDKIKIDRNAVSKIIKGRYQNVEIEIEKRRRNNLSNIKSISVKQYDETGKLINSFSSYQEAEEKLGIFNISTAVLKGNRAGGFYWISEKSPYKIEELLKKPHGKELKYKPINQYTLDGTFIASYSSLKEAAQKYHNSHIGDVCNGKRKSAAGFIWKWVEK